MYDKLTFDDVMVLRKTIGHNDLSEVKWSKYTNYKSELVCHLNIGDSKIFDTHTGTPKQTRDQVAERSTHHLSIILPQYLCFCGISR